MTCVIFFFCILFGLPLFAGRAFACTTVLVGRGASETGEVLVGHNEDSGGRYVVRTHIVPARMSAIPRVRFEPSAAALPMPATSPRLLWIEARTRDLRGSSFCDFYVNANGVVICSDSCGDSREDAPDLFLGGVGYGLRRAAAENARSALHALETAAGIVDEYGYIGSARSYHFSDNKESWVLQVVNGKHYAAKRVPDDEVYINPNHYTIRQPDPQIGDGPDAYVRERGWYDPDRDGEFDFCRAYQAPSSYRAKVNLHRHLRGAEAILGHPIDPEADLPFSVKPSEKIRVEDVKKILRSHYEGTPDDVSQGGTPHRMETRPICALSTIYSTVVQVRDNPDDILILLALGRPCLSPYVPIHMGITAAPEAFAGDGGDTALLTHFDAPASDFDHSAGAWHSVSDLQTAAELLYEERAGGVRKAVMEFEKTLEGDTRAFESGPRRYQAFAESAASRAVSVLKDLYASMNVASVSLAGAAQLNAGASPAPFTLRLENHPGGIVTEKTIFGPSHAPVTKWSKASSSAPSGGGVEISFTGGEWMADAVPCLCDMWLLAEDEKGDRVVARTLINIKI